MKKNILLSIILTEFILITIFPFPANAVVNVGISPSGHYFTYNGKTQFFLEDSGTQVVMQNLNINYAAWVETLAAEGHPGAHIWTFVAPRQKLDGSVKESRYGYVYPGISPWKRKSSGAAAFDQGKQWDLFNFDEGTNPNQNYWPRLRDLCTRLKNKNMTLGITIFFGWPKDVPGDLNYHPFHTLNGGHASIVADITNIDSPGTEIYNQTWSDGWPVRKKTQWLWEKFSLKLIETSNTCGNVWFDFRDEWSYANDTNMETHFRNFFMSRGQIWADKSNSASFRVTNPAVPSFGSSPAMKTEGPPYDHNDVKNEVWNRAIGGIHYLLHNDSREPGIMAWDPNRKSGSTNPDSDLGRKYVGYASKFFNTIVKNLDSLTPQNSLVTDGAKSLSSAGNEYVVWKQGGGNFTVNLVSGTYTELWYNPVNGTQQAAADVSGGAVKSFTPPFSNDAVLHLVKKGTTTVTPIISPSNPPPTSPSPTGSPPAGGKPGDANNDNKVDGLDYVIWLNHYNQSATGAANGDFNNSGKVDGLDYVIWLKSYGM